MKFWFYSRRRGDKPIEVVYQVTGVSPEGELMIDLGEPEDVLPTASLRMDKATAAALITVLASFLSGCATIGGYCDEQRIAAEYDHTSHPLAGWPLGEKNEEDALHQVSVLGRCTHGVGYAEIGMGYKIREAGFYGPEMTGTVRVGVTLWRRE